MESSLLKTDLEIQDLKDFQHNLASGKTIRDFDEQMQLNTIRETTRIWRQGEVIIGFAFIDDFSNLWFDVDPEFDSLDNLENEIVNWGVTCIKNHVANPEDPINLDSTCQSQNHHRIDVLVKHGFGLQEVRSLHFSRSLTLPINKYALPDGYSIRSVHGKSEVNTLVELHRAAFGTENMTIEQRLAMMNVANYDKDLDLVLVAPNGDLAAFCVCGFEEDTKETGNIDIIGTHPRYCRQGLAKVIATIGLVRLKQRGAMTAELGTSSENVAMQRFVLDLGFKCVSEQLWFSKPILK